MTQAPKSNAEWISPDSVPPPLVTSDFAMEPLHEKHAERDYSALMSCRRRLRAELQWGTWPPKNFTLDANRLDLGRHFEEFITGKAFAYTVLSPECKKCLGCIYIERCAEIDGAQLAFWVIDEALELEQRLLADVLEWIHSSWRIERVLIPLRKENSRGISIALKVGSEVDSLTRAGPLAEHRCFLSATPLAND